MPYSAFSRPRRHGSPLLGRHVAAPLDSPRFHLAERSPVSLPSCPAARLGFHGGRGRAPGRTSCPSMGRTGTVPPARRSRVADRFFWPKRCRSGAANTPRSLAGWPIRWQNRPQRRTSGADNQLPNLPQRARSRLLPPRRDEEPPRRNAQRPPARSDFGPNAARRSRTRGRRRAPPDAARSGGRST